METVYFVVVVVGFVAVIITMLIASHLERLETARINKQKEIAFAKLLRLNDPNSIVALEQVPVIEEKEEEGEELVDVSDMPSLPMDKEE